MLVFRKELNGLSFMIILYELLRETPDNYTAFSLSLNF